VLTAGQLLLRKQGLLEGNVPSFLQRTFHIELSLPAAANEPTVDTAARFTASFEQFCSSSAESACTHMIECVLALQVQCATPFCKAVIAAVPVPIASLQYSVL
jgi:hypothetical protein